MTETLQKEMPLCCVCGDPTEAEIYDPALGTLCYECRNAAAQAEVILNQVGLKTILTTPKNNHRHP